MARKHWGLVLAITGIACFVGIVIAALNQPSGGESARPLTIESLWEGRITGQLGVPVGELMVIEGRRIEDPYTSHPWRRPPFWASGVHLNVTKVQGEHLPAPVCVNMTGSYWSENGGGLPAIGETFAYLGHETIHLYVDRGEKGGQEIRIFSGFFIRVVLRTDRDFDDFKPPPGPEAIDSVPIGSVADRTVLGTLGVPVGSPVRASGKRVPDPRALFYSNIRPESEVFMEFESVDGESLSDPVVMKLFEKGKVLPISRASAMEKPLEGEGRELLYLYIISKRLAGGPHRVIAYPRFEITSLRNVDGK